MSDDSNVSVNGEIDAGWSSYWGEEQSQVVGPDRENADADGEVSVNGGPGDVPEDNGGAQCEQYAPDGDGWVGPEIATVNRRDEISDGCSANLIVGFLPNHGGGDTVETYLAANSNTTQYEQELSVTDMAGNPGRVSIYISARQELNISPGDVVCVWLRPCTADGLSRDESGSEDVREWPPDGRTKTEIRQRLLDGETAAEVSEEFPVSKYSIRSVARADEYTGVPSDIPPLTARGSGMASYWVRDNQSDNQNDNQSETPKWPPSAEKIDSIRRRLVSGEAATTVAEDYPRSGTACGSLAKGESFEGHPEVEAAETPAIKCPGGQSRKKWTWPDGYRDGSDVEGPAREEETETTTTEGSPSPDVTGQRLDVPPVRRQRQTDRRGVALSIALLGGLVYLLRRWMGDSNSGGEGDE